ncbi:MAG: hypothetical protein ACFFDT_04820 [Candidatus Hodarchaeota archaeon]
MNRGTDIKGVVLLLFLVISITGSSARYSMQELEWKVKEGDTQTYSVKKCFDNTDLDRDGDKNSIKVNITDEDGNLVEISLKKGSTLKAEIVSLDSSNSDNATVKLTYNDEVTEKPHSSFFFYNATPFVIKTVDNKSYWEDWAETNNFSVEGDLLVISGGEKILWSPMEVTVKWNWTTGWLTFFSFTMYSKEEIALEFEFSTGIYTDTTPTRFVSGWHILFLCFSLFVLTRLRQFKKRS